MVLLAVMKHFYTPEVREVRGWSLEQVASLSLDHVRALRPPEIRSLSHEQIAALTPEQATALSPQQVRHLEVAFLSVEAREALMQCWVDYDADGFLSIYGHLEPCERDYTETYHGGTKFVWVPVWVRLEDPTIDKVYCVGDFNNWGVAVPLAPVRQRLFAGEVQMAPGRWKYGFVAERSQPLVGGFAETIDMGREAYWATDPLTPSFSFPGRGPREYHSVEIGDPTPRVRVLEEDVACVQEAAPPPVPKAHRKAAMECLPPDWFDSFWRDHYDRDEGGPRGLLVPTVWNNPERMLTRGEMLAWVNQVGDIAEGEIYPLKDPTTGEIIDETAEDASEVSEEDDTSRIETWELDDNPFAHRYRNADGSRVEFSEDPETDAAVAAHIFTAFPEVNNSVLPDVRQRLLAHLLKLCSVEFDEDEDIESLALRYRTSVVNSETNVRELVPDIVDLIVDWTDGLVSDIVEGKVVDDDEEEDDVAAEDEDEDDDEYESDEEEDGLDDDDHLTRAVLDEDEDESESDAEDEDEDEDGDAVIEADEDERDEDLDDEIN